MASIEIIESERSLAAGDITPASKVLADAHARGAPNGSDEKTLLTNVGIAFSMIAFRSGLKDSGEPMSGKVFAEKIQAMAEKNPGIMANFGGEEKFRETLQNISRIDATFESKGGIYFHLGSSPAETAEAFTRIHVEQYRETGRPSLPALVANHLDALSLSSDNPHYKAAMLVAARAELEHAVVPQYHNTNHYADVTAQVAEFLKRDNELADKGVPGAQKLSVEEMADSITAAVGHDLDHPGGKNALPGQKPGEYDPYRLEEQSFKAMEPLLKEAGLGEKAVGDIHIMIQTTSPDGPHGVLKAVARAQQEGQPVDWAKIDPQNKFPELRVLADDPKLTVRAAILEDSDLGASAFEGVRSNVKMSDAFTKELQEREYRALSGPNAGKLENLNGPFAREGFSQFVVGQGPASAAAQDAVGQNYTAMRASTQQEIAAIKAGAPDADGKGPAVAKQASATMPVAEPAGQAPPPNGRSAPIADGARLQESSVADRLLARATTLLMSETDLNKKLLESARNGDLKGMQKWLDAGADIHFGQDAAVGQAAMNGRVEALEFLKSRGANLHAKGDYALSVTATEGHPDAVRYLLREGLSPLAVTPEASILIEARRVQSPDRYGNILSMLRDPAQVADPGTPSSGTVSSKSPQPGVPQPTVEKSGSDGQGHQSTAGVSRGVLLGGAGVGLALSVPQLLKAVKEGDNVSIAVNGAGVLANVGSLATMIPGAVKMAKVVPGLNVAAIVGSIALDAAKEDTTKHKIERASEGAVLAGTGLAIGAAAGAATVGAGAAATLTAALAPVVLPLATVAVAKVDADLVIDTHRVYEANDKALAEMKAGRVPLARHDGPPTIYGFKTLPGVVAGILGSDLGLKGEVFINGRMVNLSDPNTLREIDFSKPGALKLLEQVLDKKIVESQALKNAADYSFLPRAVRSDDGSRAYNEAELQLRTLQVARDELAMLKKDAATYNEKSGVKPGTNDVVNDGGIQFKVNLNNVFGDSAAGTTAGKEKPSGNSRAAPKPDAGP